MYNNVFYIGFKFLLKVILRILCLGIAERETETTYSGGFYLTKSDLRPRPHE